MRPEVEKSIEICIRGIDGLNSENEDSFFFNTIRQLAKEPYKGSGLGIGDKHGDYRSSWEDMLKRFDDWREGISSALTWKDAMLVLFDGENLNAEQMLIFAQKIQSPIIFNHVLKHIIENLVALDNIPKAQEYTLLFRKYPSPPYNHSFYYGYRIIARYYAQKADTNNFFKLFKMCEPKYDRNNMETIKQVLVESVCQQQGIEAALQLCQHKNIGERYYFYALNIFAQKGEYTKLKEIFETHPQLKQPEKETELNILVQAYAEANKRKLLIEDDFEFLFERTQKVNPKLKWGDAKLRDSLFLDLGLGSGNNQERVIRCRKAIKNNWLKKELH